MASFSCGESLPRRAGDASKPAVSSSSRNVVACDQMRPSIVAPLAKVARRWRPPCSCRCRGRLRSRGRWSRSRAADARGDVAGLARDLDRQLPEEDRDRLRSQSRRDHVAADAADRARARAARTSVRVEEVAAGDDRRRERLERRDADFDGARALACPRLRAPAVEPRVGATGEAEVVPVAAEGIAVDAPARLTPRASAARAGWGCPRGRRAGRSGRWGRSRDRSRPRCRRRAAARPWRRGRARGS
jgi:hypothetical protein